MYAPTPESGFEQPRRELLKAASAVTLLGIFGLGCSRKFDVQNWQNSLVDELRKYGAGLAISLLRPGGERSVAYLTDFHENSQQNFAALAALYQRGLVGGIGIEGECEGADGPQVAPHVRAEIFEEQKRLERRYRVPEELMVRPTVPIDSFPDQARKLRADIGSPVFGLEARNGYEGLYCLTLLAGLTKLVSPAVEVFVVSNEEKNSKLGGVLLYAAAVENIWQRYDSNAPTLQFETFLREGDISLRKGDVGKLKGNVDKILYAAAGEVASQARTDAAQKVLTREMDRLELSQSAIIFGARHSIAAVGKKSLQRAIFEGGMNVCVFDSKAVGAELARIGMTTRYVEARDREFAELQAASKAR
jgi:hypothetical protein